MATFAGEPEEIGERYISVAQTARVCELPEQELLNYLNAMISEAEKQDIGAAYYEDGYDDGLKKRMIITAQIMLAEKEPLEKIMKYSGLSLQEIQELQLHD